jgi:AcrR family transcriptional regulator
MSSAPEQPIWARPEPGARRPAHTREAIANAGIAIADAEGLDAVSMRRIAADLGAGTMTLYHYVRTKSELFALMDDVVMGELIVPDDELGEGWRDGFAAIARRSRDVALRHPWLLEVKGGSTTGPGALRHVEQSLAVASLTGLDGEGQMELIMIVDDFVFGHMTRLDNHVDTETWIDAFAEYVGEQFKTGEFPHLEALAGDDLRSSLMRMADKATDDRRFERGLEMLLDGIDIEVKKNLRKARSGGRGQARGRARTSGGGAARRASG